MATRHDRQRPVEDESREALPDEHQGFVRGRDVNDTKSQAAAPQRAAHELDRSGEKHYEADLKRFEREHDAALAKGRAGPVDDHLDEILRETLCRRLADDAGLDGVSIDVEIHGGVATLSGEVDSAATRRRVEEIASAITGIDEVLNQLDVRDGAADE
jgi:osmotically-inducible protein OsmY